MFIYRKAVLCLSIFVCCTVLFYLFNPLSEKISTTNEYNNAKASENTKKTNRPASLRSPNMTSVTDSQDDTDAYNVWCIFTKVQTNAPLKFKFKTFVHSMLNHTKVKVRLHLLSDEHSWPLAKEVVQAAEEATGKRLRMRYYDVVASAAEVEDIVQAMKPHFSSQPGTYYSDSLFFLSLGLHRIARDQSRAVLFDADTKLQADVADLFLEMDKFTPEALFGLSPELTPVYRHILYSYRARNPDTGFGNPSASGGDPGLNSGVVLLNLDRMRRSEEYRGLLTGRAVKDLAVKYSFKGHLGDQDFYTLLHMERPTLVHVLPCGWNRQLCTWWKDHGYKEVFDQFHRCTGPVFAYHGNCNTAIPV